MHLYSVPQTEYFAKQCFHSVNADNLYEVYVSDIMKCKFDYKNLEDTFYQIMHLADVYTDQFS